MRFFPPTRSSYWRRYEQQDIGEIGQAFRLQRQASAGVLETITAKQGRVGSKRSSIDEPSRSGSEPVCSWTIGGRSTLIKRFTHCNGGAAACKEGLAFEAATCRQKPVARDGLQRASHLHRCSSLSGGKRVLAETPAALIPAMRPVLVGAIARR